MTAITTDSDRARRRRRKVAAVLAGGLVLGVGTMATLASWNDSEFVSGTFTAGRFNLEGSTDGGLNYTEHSDVAEPGAISFSLPVNNLSPGDIVDGGFTVRLAAGTTHDARLKVTKAASTGAFEDVAVLVWESVTRDCAAVYDSEHLLSFMMDGEAFPGARPTLTKGATDAEAGEPIQLCFKVIPGDDMPQGQTGTFVWNLQATSVQE